MVASNFATPGGSSLSALGSVLTCFVAVDFSGSYVQGTGYSISNAQMIAAITSERRNNSTISILDVMSAAPGQEGSTSAFVMSGPVTYAAIGNAITGLLYGPDLATEHANATMGTFSTPLTFAVTFAEQYAA